MVKVRMKILFPFALFLSVSFITNGHKSRPYNPLFKSVSDYPTIKDTNQFIKKLKKFCNFKVSCIDIKKCSGEHITYYKKVKLYGDTNQYILLEYEYDYECAYMEEYPFKYQILFTTGGRLLKILDAIRFELLTVFKDQGPFLLMVESTSAGNGGHKLYRISNGKLINVYDGFKDYFPRTYDADADNNINSPFELNLSIKDENGDGYNDLVFSGIIIHDNIKQIPVEYIFLYNPETGHFTEKEDYSKEYIYLDKN